MRASNSLISAIRNRWKLLRLRLTPKSKRFHEIYRTFHWNGGGETLSGAGSTIVATEMIRKELPAYLASVDCRMLLDLGCGDFNWMRMVDLPCKYIGADIVDDVIKQNQVHYGGQQCSFVVLDGVSESLPLGVDVILCREVLFHLSFADVFALLENVKASDARILVATNMTGVEINRDIFTGGFRPIDLRLPPFNFPAPHHMIPDQGIARNRYLCAWNVKELP